MAGSCSPGPSHSAHRSAARVRGDQGKGVRQRRRRGCPDPVGTSVLAYERGRRRATAGTRVWVERHWEAARFFAAPRVRWPVGTCGPAKSAFSVASAAARPPRVDSTATPMRADPSASAVVEDVRAPREGVGVGSAARERPEASATPRAPRPPRRRDGCRSYRSSRSSHRCSMPRRSRRRRCPWRATYVRRRPAERSRGLRLDSLEPRHPAKTTAPHLWERRAPGLRPRSGPAGGSSAAPRLKQRGMQCDGRRERWQRGGTIP